MTKRCPIMSKQTESHSKVYCFKNECALWDESRGQCCILTQALAAVTDPLDKIREQAMYIPTCSTTEQGQYTQTKIQKDIDLLLKKIKEDNIV